MKILILCTGNSCRSQMAEGILAQFSKKLEVFSAGTEPEKRVNPIAIKVMSEASIDISSKHPKNVNCFVVQPFDYVITVCDGAKEKCPVFIGKVGRRLHFGFPDPAKAQGTEEEIANYYRKIRDEIYQKFKEFYEKEIANVE